MEINVRQSGGKTEVETFDPSMNEGQGGVCRNDICVGEGQEIKLTLPDVHSPEGIQVGEVVAIATPEGEGGEGQAEEPQGGGEAPPAEGGESGEEGGGE